MRRVVLRADKWSVSGHPPCVTSLRLWFGVGWSKVTCDPVYFRGVIRLPVYRAKTGHLLGMVSVTRADCDGLTLQQQRSKVCMAISRFTSASAGQVGTGHMADPKLAAACPLLHEYLTAESFPDGEMRQGATIMLFSAPDGWKALLNERDQELNLWGTGESLQDALDCLEALLGQDSPPWRRPKAWKPSGPVGGDASRPLPNKKGGRKKS